MKEGLGCRDSSGMSASRSGECDSSKVYIMYGPRLHNLATAQFVALCCKFLINAGFWEKFIQYGLRLLDPQEKISF